MGEAMSGLIAKLRGAELLKNRRERDRRGLSANARPKGPRGRAAPDAILPAPQDPAEIFSRSLNFDSLAEALHDGVYCLDDYEAKQGGRDRIAG
jgi:hypothetical protein